MSRPEELLRRRASATDVIGGVLLGLGVTFLLLSAVGGVALWSDLEDTSLSTAGKLEVLLGPVVSAVLLSLVLAAAGTTMRLLSAHVMRDIEPAPARKTPDRSPLFDIGVGVGGALLLIAVIAMVFATR